MTVVVDSSVTMAWCFRDETTPYVLAVLERVRDEGAIVPGVWPLEVANTLLVGERRRRLREAETLQFVELLGDLDITMDPPDTDAVWEAVLPLARTHGLSSYDASYLELAARQGLPLATLDKDLRAAAGRLGVALVA